MARMVHLVGIGGRMVVAPTIVEMVDQEVKQSRQKILDTVLIIEVILKAIFTKHSKYFQLLI